MFFRRKKSTPKLPESYFSEEEKRLTAMAEAEMPTIPEPSRPNLDNMPFGIFFPRLRNQDGLGFKPISRNGTTMGRSVDDANDALEQNRIRDLRRKSD